jgi:Phage protein (N4 Gp49/phage Sf6 gene 66) family
VTIGSITLDNGYSVRGESACVNPENYNQQIGEKIAYDNAFRQLWPLFGFLLAEKNKLKAAA